LSNLLLIFISPQNESTDKVSRCLWICFHKFHLVLISRLSIRHTLGLLRSRGTLLRMEVMLLCNELAFDKVFDSIFNTSAAQYHAHGKLLCKWGNSDSFTLLTYLR